MAYGQLSANQGALTPNLNVVIDDNVKRIYAGRVQLVDRLLADTCELWGGHVDVEVHHIKKLNDLQKTWQGRKEQPEGVKSIIAIRRKTLVGCLQYLTLS